MPDISPKPLRILALEAQNIKKLRAIEIAPHSSVVRIQGANGSGKTSTLDAIMWALGGKKGIQMKPVRKGEERGVIKLGLGGEALEYVITRSFRQEDEGEYTTSLLVESAKGAMITSPQKFLDDLFGTLSLDPLEFIRMDPKQRVKALKAIVQFDVDVDELDAINNAEFEKRKEINREVDRLEKEVGLYAGGLNANMDITPIDTAPLFKAMEEASEKNVDIERRRIARTTNESELRQRKADLNKLDAEIARLTARRAEMAKEIEDNEKQIAGWQPLPDMIDTADLTEKIKEAQRENSAREIQRRARERHAEAKKAFTTKKAESDALTKSMAERTAQKEAALARAKFPVEGLAFGGDGVLFNEVPFDQASAAEQMRVSFGIAASVRPRLPVVLIRDGSLLDDRSMALLEELAEKYGAQVWLERVGAGNVGIVLEDGVVVAVDGEPVT